MASITIRMLDESTKLKLRIRAAHNSRSMEDEARNILRAALVEDSTPTTNLAQTIHERFKSLGGLDLELPARKKIRRPPEFNK